MGSPAAVAAWLSPFGITIEGTTSAGTGASIASHPITSEISQVYFANNNGHLAGGPDTLALLEDSSSYVAAMVLEPSTGYTGLGRVYVSGNFHMFSDPHIATDDNQATWTNLLVWMRSGVVFTRGDCNDDGGVDLADAIATLTYLFSSSGDHTCKAGCDVNDDDQLDISDPIFTLSMLFDGGPLPPAPYPDCGADPDPGVLICTDHTACP